MKIAIAFDHGAYDFRQSLIEHLNSKGHEVEDFGTYSKESCDYPDHGKPAVESVAKAECDKAILCCSNGIGMTMLANKVSGIRAAMVYSKTSAKATREHHDSNILCLGAKEFTSEDLLSFVDIWLTTPFEGGRHLRRINKFPSQC
ncbi:MAG: RpiB/LacA/LacB family sugar-phosphate isomerase [Planctomycetes bacterium]|nr:RpiB/LacA/LacB family sugar-phosphate isomerase [Planctomycetota bacterium]